MLRAHYCGLYLMYHHCTAPPWGFFFSMKSSFFSSFLPPGSNRNSRGSQLESSHDNWESRSSAVRERSAERSTDRSATERSSERGSDRDRYEGDRRGEPSRDSSYDRRGGHGERDRRDNRERGGGLPLFLTKQYINTYIKNLVP